MTKKTENKPENKEDQKDDQPNNPDEKKDKSPFDLKKNFNFRNFFSFVYMLLIFFS